MSEPSLEAEPLTRAQIREFALQVRILFGMEKTPYIDVEKFIEFELPSKIQNFTYDILPKLKLGDTHGFAKPDQAYVCLREDVYLGACDGFGRDRSTVIHEIGHLLLHGSERIRHRRGTGVIKPYRDPEWQAKAFAGEFLIAAHLVHMFRTISEVAAGFGVSKQAAAYQLKQYLKEGIIKRGQIKDLDP